MTTITPEILDATMARLMDLSDRVASGRDTVAGWNDLLAQLGGLQRLAAQRMADLSEVVL